MAKRPTKSASQRSFSDGGDPKEVPLAPLPRVQAPIGLSQVLGQERAVSVLSEAMASERVHHAWMFQGEFGVGKFTSALAFAACLLDPTTEATFSGEIAPDPESRVQQMLRAGSHPDLAVVNKEMARFHTDRQVRDRKQTNIPIDVVREFILDPGGLAPQVSPGGRAGRVFIIDEAELLGIAAQNAILKFLEEPPQRTVLILVCNNPDLLLPTIRSRCQRVTFSTLDPKAMQQWLKGRDMELTPVQREWLLAFSAGSPGSFLRAHETGIHAWWQKIEPMLAQAQQGRHVVELGPAMHELTDGWAKAWVDSHDNASKEAANTAAAEWMFRLIAWWLGGRLRGALKGGGADVPLAQIDALRAAEAELGSNVSLQFVMEKLAAEIAAAARGEAPV